MESELPKKRKPEQNRLNDKELIAARHAIGLYSINELKVMFGCSRYSIDNILGLGELKFISPNNKNKFIFIQDFIKVLEKTKKEPLAELPGTAND